MIGTKGEIKENKVMRESTKIWNFY